MPCIVVVLLWVFPAHAGMSPPRRLTSPGGVGFPRSRGDEPPRNTPDLILTQFSPLTRG